jgi:hypothetical protein
VRRFLFLAVALPCVAQQALTWTMAPAIRDNTNFSVTVRLQANSGPAAINFTVAVPPATTFVGGNPGAAATAAAKGLRCGPVTSTMVCVIWGLNLNTMSDGVLATLVFQTTAAAGPLPFSMSLPVAASPAGLSLPITAPPPIGILVIARCDLNGDGVVNQVDANLLNAQLVAAAPRLTCDLNSDGVCDSLDLQLVVDAAQPGGMCTATSFRGPA